MPALLLCIKALQAAVVSFVWSQGVGGFITLCPDVFRLQLMLRCSLGFMGSVLDAVLQHGEWYRLSPAFAVHQRSKCFQTLSPQCWSLAAMGFLLLPSLVVAGLLSCGCSGSEGTTGTSGTSPCLLCAAVSSKTVPLYICRHITGVCCSSCAAVPAPAPCPGEVGSTWITPPVPQ